jgi:hypothetical protein
MSDRKYRQRGYMDDDRDRRPREPRRDVPRASEPRPPGEPRGRPREPRAPNLPGVRTVLRCFRCGSLEDPDIGALSRCRKCGVDLHSCAECLHFDPGARFECTQSIPARVSPKDVRNECGLFEPRTTIERETTSAGPPDARKAFDDLFK